VIKDGKAKNEVRREEEKDCCLKSSGQKSSLFTISKQEHEEEGHK
jgi:hypothetical protein